MPSDRILGAGQLKEAAHDQRAGPQHFMAQRGLNTVDKKLVRIMEKRVGLSLRDHRKRGLMRSEQGPGRFKLWELGNTQIAVEPDV